MLLNPRSSLALALILALMAGTPPAKAEDMAAALQTAVAAGELEGLHAVYVLHEGKPLAEAYFSGPDQRWGEHLRERQFAPDALHDVRSVTKSIVGLLYGIALEEGIVPPVEASLTEAFPEYADLAADPARRKITIGHTLAMTMGLEWNEDLPYTDPANSEVAMEQAPDRYRFALDRPIASGPGAEWTYSGGATALIGRLISKGAGMPLDDYAREKLFEPLGIEKFEWIDGADGAPSAASGLRLTAPDLAKIGQMVLDGGKWGGAQVVPASWVREALSPRTAANGLRYGYFWWLAPGEGDPFWVAAFGNGGQALSVNRRLNAVVVILAGNYNRRSNLTEKVIVDFVVPPSPRAGNALTHLLV